MTQLGSTARSHATALVLVDLQNDNVHPEGAYAATGTANVTTTGNIVADFGPRLVW